jgi:hypothetical protein
LALFKKKRDPVPAPPPALPEALAVIQQRPETTERRAGIEESVSQLRAAGYDVDRQWIVVQYGRFADGSSAMGAANQFGEQHTRRLETHVVEAALVERALQEFEVLAALPPDMKEKARALAAGFSGHLLILVHPCPLSDVDSLFDARARFILACEEAGGTYDDFLMTQ